MPSANKTPNYGLNQWQANEYPKREDFVSDNAIIDATLKANADAIAGKQGKIMTSGILKGDGAGGVTTAAAGTDYQPPTNPNLLHNWDFRNPVNQRGLSSYGGGNIYTIDRWKILGAGSVTLNSGYITLAASVPELQFLQWIEPAYSRFAGKTLTISAMLANGTILSGSATVPAVKPSAWTNIINIITSFGYVQFDYDNTVDMLFFTVIVSDGKTVDLAAVKTEISGVSTLANDPPADYAIEFAKCVQYDLSTGSFVGPLSVATGTITGVTTSTPVSVTLPHAPIFVIVKSNYNASAINCSAVLFDGNTQYLLFGSSTFDIGLQANLSGATLTISRASDLQGDPSGIVTNYVSVYYGG